MKVLIIMYLCSQVPGNACKLFKPEYTEFKTYKECAIYGYEYSAELMTNFSDSFVEDFNPYIVFDCKQMAET